MMKFVFFIVLMIAILGYAITRIVSMVLLVPDYSWIEITFAAALLFAEIFILIHALGYAIDLFRASAKKDIKDYPINPLPFPPPEVAILVAARHEPRHVLEATFNAIVNLRYPSKTVYFLDDSSDEPFSKEADELAKKYGLVIFRRKIRHGAKAGIINDCLKTLKEKYVAIFDADQNPMPNFLLTMIPLLEANKKLAFIQTPQFYSNIGTNRVARAAAFQQAVFFEYICEAKGSNESMFCCGTNVVFRRDALMSVGGLDETVVTEDFATSVKLHLSKWKSLYYNHVGTFGMAPENLGAYFKQQSRWAKGTVGVLRKILRNFVRRPFALSLSQWWEYALSGTYYFIGMAFFVLMICPIAYVLFDIPSFFIHTDIYVSAFVPYFLLSLGIFHTTLRVRRYKSGDLILGQMLAYVAFPTLVIAVIEGLLGIQGEFGITQKASQTKLPTYMLWPQITFMMLNFIALVWGLNRFYYEQDASILVNCIWVLYHCLMMAGIFYFNVDSAKHPLEGKTAS